MLPLKRNTESIPVRVVPPVQVTFWTTALSPEPLLCTCIFQGAGAGSNESIEKPLGTVSSIVDVVRFAFSVGTESVNCCSAFAFATVGLMIACADAAAAKPLPPFSPTVTVDGYRFTMQGGPRLAAIQPAFLTVTVRDPQGRPATFTPWFGALAHAIFFRRGSLDYFHTHVCSPGATGCTSVLGATRVAGTSSTPGRLRVGVLVPVSGTWRLFLQCKVNGKILTAPFTLTVR